MTALETSPALAALVLASPTANTSRRAAAAAGAPELAARIGGVALVTCHRVEVYATPDGIADGATGQAGRAWRAADRFEGLGAARHAVSVAVGLESAVLGEDQVLHQLRSSVAAARRRGLADPLEIVFAHALRAGRTARSWRPARPRSLADMAVARLAAVRPGGLAGAAVLVVGAGEMGSLAATAAAASGARVVVASPTAGHAAAVADAVGGTAAPFDPGPAALVVDGVIVALSGRWRGSRETREAIARVPLVVDLSMPRALPQDVITRLGSRYVDLDAIAEPRDAASPAGDRASERYRERLEALRDRTVEACLERLSGRASGDLAVTLARRVEAERRAELDVLWRRLPHVPPDERHAIEAMTRHLAGRLFRAPLSRLASERDGQRRRLARELFEL